MLSQLLQNNDSFEFRQVVDWKGLGLMDYPNVVKYPMDLGTCREKLKNNEYNYVEECLDDIQLVWDNCKNYNAEGSWIYKLADKLEKHFKNMIKNYIPSIQFMSAIVSKIHFYQLLSLFNFIPFKEKDRLAQLKKEQEQENFVNSQNGVQNEQGYAPNYGGNKNAEQNNQIYQEDDSESITIQDKIQFSQKIKMLPTEQLGMIVLMIQNSASQAFKDLDKDKCQIIVDQIDVETFKKINQQIQFEYYKNYTYVIINRQIDLWNVTTETIIKRVKI